MGSLLTAVVIVVVALIGMYVLASLVIAAFFWVQARRVMADAFAELSETDHLPSPRHGGVRGHRR